MKKIIVSLALMLTCLAGFAQTANDIVSQLKNEEGVEAQVLTKMMLQMQFAQAPDEKTKALGKKINSMTILSLDKASDEVKATFNEMVGKLIENGYEKIEETEEIGMKAIGYIKADGETVKELVNIVEGQGMQMFILINGKFSREDLEILNNM